MKTDLEARRQKLLAKLAQVDRQIAQTQRRLTRVAAQIARATKLQRIAA